MDNVYEKTKVEAKGNGLKQMGDMAYDVCVIPT